jgi:D-alanyl-D-alanine dipeptidase
VRTRAAIAAIGVCLAAGSLAACASDAERRPDPAREGRVPAVRGDGGSSGGAAVASREGTATAAGSGGAAAAAAPRGDDLVDIAAMIPDAVLDLRYATADNFTGAVLYPRAICKLRRTVAERLARAAELLRPQGRRLLLWDCYRPSSIQERFWQLVPDSRYVANPKVGSRHSRGAAVDVALADAAGRAVELPTKFDEFSEAAHRSRALAGPRGAEARRLADAMLAAGFTGMPTEWWHFDAPDSGQYALSNEPL